MKRGTRFKKREGRMQARRGAPSGKGRGSRPDERQTAVRPDERQTTVRQTAVRADCASNGLRPDEQYAHARS